MYSEVTSTPKDMDVLSKPRDHRECKDPEAGKG